MNFTFMSESGNFYIQLKDIGKQSCKQAKIIQERKGLNLHIFYHEKNALAWCVEVVCTTGLREAVNECFVLPMNIDGI